MCTLALVAVLAPSAYGAELSGKVVAAGSAVAGAQVTLYAGGESAATRLGSARTGRRGGFRVTYTPQAGSVVYAVASRQALRLIGVAAPGGSSPRRLVLNELTTVAAAYSLSRFLRGVAVSGPSIGLRNAAGTVPSLVVPATGRVGPAISNPPNGDETQALATFRTLAAILGGCTTGGQRNCARLFDAATPRGGRRPSNTLAAIHAIALNPVNNVRRIFALPKSRAYRPTLPQAPSSWVLALKHTAGGFDGPGRMAFDSVGNIWVTNNFQPPGTGPGLYTIGLDPTGRPRTTAPFVDGTLSGGGVQGNWWGIAVDGRDRVWLSNFTGDDPNQFFSPAFKGGTVASMFNQDGTTPYPTGITAGSLLAPQGIGVDTSDNVYVANHGNDTVTMYPGGDPSLAKSFTGNGIYNPFAIVTDDAGNAWVNNGSLDTSVAGSVTRIGADGSLTGPLSAPNMRSPQGMAIDSAGGLWIASLGDSTVTWMAPDGTVKGQFTAPAIDVAWGVAIDGNDNVWVASFVGETLTMICGRRPSTCPAGSETGDVLSPRRTGFTNGGLQHLTAVQVDQSGNVWVANNWARLAPTVGGDGLVEFIGAAAPVKTPLIGLPERP